MNDSTKASNLDDFQIRLDRLADGELPLDEQRQLLTALENQPDGWRRCALAFVESQAWRGEMQRLTSGANLTPSELADREQTIAIAPRADGQRWTLNRWRWFAMAASVLVAFLLGLAAQNWLPKSGTTDHAQQIATTQPETSPAAPQENAVAGTEKQSDASTGTTSGKWQALKVTIPSADGTGEQTVEVPLVEADEQKIKSMMEKQEPLLSDVALEALQNTGHEVKQHRAYYPVQLEDGTQAVVPMDFVEVRNTSAWQ